MDKRKAIIILKHIKKAFKDKENIEAFNIAIKCIEKCVSAEESEENK